MALPTRPIFQDELVLGNRNKEEYLLMAVYVIRTLGWQVTNVETTKLHAFTEKDGEVFEVKFVHGTMIFSSKSIDLLTINEPKNRENIAAFKHAFESQQHHKEEHGELRNDPVPEPETVEVINTEIPSVEEGNAWAIFIPQKNFFVTPLIMYTCVVVFLAMVFSGANFFNPSVKSLIAWGANYSTKTLAGEWWRLVTSLFVHVGILHVALNLFGLLIVAVFLEPILGRWRFFAAYMVTGVLGNITSLWWHTFIISAGASGAIFGLYGVYLALLASDVADKNFRKDGLIFFGVLVVLNLLSGLKEGIDNAAHIGGLFSGFLIGYMYYFSLKIPEKVWLKYVSVAAVLLMGTGITYFALMHIPNFMALYSKNINKFSENETQAIRIYSIPDSTTKNYKLYTLDHEGIQLWEQNIQLIKEMDKIPRVPQEFQDELDRLRIYSQWSKSSCELRYRRVKFDTNIYDDSIKKLEVKIDSIVKTSNAVDSTDRRGE